MYYFDAILIKFLFWWVETWHNSEILNLTFILPWKPLEEAFVSIKMFTDQKIYAKYISCLQVAASSIEHVDYFCTVTWGFCIYKINGCKLLISFERVFKEPIKVFHHQKLANHWRFNGALVIEKISNSFGESIKKFGGIVWQKRNVLKNKREMGSDTSCAEQQSCLYLCQISASSELVQNMLQKRAVKTRRWYVNVFSN